MPPMCPPAGMPAADPALVSAARATRTTATTPTASIARTPAPRQKHASAVWHARAPATACARCFARPCPARAKGPGERVAQRATRTCASSSGNEYGQTPRTALNCNGPAPAAGPPLPHPPQATKHPLLIAWPRGSNGPHSWFGCDLSITRNAIRTFSPFRGGRGAYGAQCFRHCRFQWKEHP